MVLLAVGLGRDAERGNLNRGRKTVETRRVIGQQPGARTLVGRNMGQELKECLIGMRLGLCPLVLDEIHGVGVEGASRLSGLSFR